jgi:hypothetical protein
MDLIAVVLLTLNKDNLTKVIKAVVAVWNASNQLLVSRVISKILENCQFDDVFRLVLECGDLDFALFLTQRTECVSISSHTFHKVLNLERTNPLI